MIIDYNKVMKRDKDHAYLSGQIYTYREILDNFSDLMSDELRFQIFKTLARLEDDKMEVRSLLYEEWNKRKEVA